MAAAEQHPNNAAPPPPDCTPPLKMILKNSWAGQPHLQLMLGRLPPPSARWLSASRTGWLASMPAYRSCA